MRRETQPCGRFLTTSNVLQPPRKGNEPWDPRPCAPVSATRSLGHVCLPRDLQLLESSPRAPVCLQGQWGTALGRAGLLGEL